MTCLLFPQLTAVRVVKLLRLLKMARVLKASRILKRQLLDFIMGKLETTFAELQMYELLAYLMLWSHWQVEPPYRLSCSPFAS